jgi:pimeloyl-ACP methyl ester carboxylesterase
MSAKPHPIVFIHGLWFHAGSWQPWEDFFRAHGYTTYAPGWPGDQDDVERTRAHPEAVADVGFDDVVTHYAQFIADLAAPPILVGQSFGGMIAEKMLGQDRAVAAIAIDAPRVKGAMRAPFSAIRAALPLFRNPANRHRAISLSREQFRYSIANTASGPESDELYDRWTIPTPGRLLFEAGLASFTPDSPDALASDENPDRGPLLLVMVGRDRAVPEAITKASYGLYGDPIALTDLLELRNRGHSLTIDAGWPELADDCLVWLEKQGL